MPFGLFYKCKNLKSVNIPKNSVEIRTYAFYQCGMDSIFLYDKLNRIGTNVFDGCPLKCVYITAEMPPSCETKPFFQSGKGRTLYVPLGCVERYSLSPAWKEFENVKSQPFLIKTTSCFFILIQKMSRLYPRFPILTLKCITVI